MDDSEIECESIQRHNHGNDDRHSFENVCVIIVHMCCCCSLMMPMLASDGAAATAVWCRCTRDCGAR